MKWEKLTTYDRVMHNLKHGRYDTKFLPNDTGKRLHKDLLHVAPHRFEITDRAAERIRDAMVNYPELLVDNGEFAIPPFEDMWVEFDNRVMTHHELLNPFMRDGADVRVGYWFSKGNVVAFSEGPDYNPRGMLYGFKLHEPMPMDSQSSIAKAFGVPLAGLDPFLWGHALHEHLAEDYCSALRRKHTLIVSTEGPSASLTRLLYYAGAGELRNILAILLTLNQPADVAQVRKVPFQRGLVRGKPTPFFGHNMVDINIDAKRRVNVLSPPAKESHRSMRWHEVRGHFCHNRASRSVAHPHIWQEYEPRRWECVVADCGAKRWWREYPDGHGSGQVGFVHQRRRVKTKQD